MTMAKRLSKFPWCQPVTEHLRHCLKIFRDLGGHGKRAFPWGDAFLYAYYHNGPSTIGERVRRSLPVEWSLNMNRVISQDGVCDATDTPLGQRLLFKKERVAELQSLLARKYLSTLSDPQALGYIATMLSPIVYAMYGRLKFSPYAMACIKGLPPFTGADPKGRYKRSDWYEREDEWAFQAADRFLDGFFDKTSPFALHGKYCLVLVSDGGKLHADLISSALLGSIRSSIDRQRKEDIGFGSALSTWASVANDAINSLLKEFEDLINSSASREPDFQRFFERNPEFLCLLGDYDDVRSQVTFCMDVFWPFASAGRPDFFLHRLTEDTWDLLEIKKASYTGPLILTKSRAATGVYPSAILNRALAQVRAYDQLLQQQPVAYALGQEGIIVGRPRLILLIGKKESFPNVHEKQAVERDAKIDIITYDAVASLARHRRWALIS